MITLDEVRSLALSLPDVVEQLHFEKPAFRVKNKIFATLWVPENRAVLKLSPVDQSVFSDFNKEIFSSVGGVWGKRGWTIVELKKVRKQMFKDALSQAYYEVARKK